MGATVFEIAWGFRLDLPPPLVKGVGTKRLGKGRVKRPKFFSATFSLRVEQNLVNLGRFTHFSQKVAGVTLNKCKFPVMAAETILVYSLRIFLDNFSSFVFTTTSSICCLVKNFQLIRYFSQRVNATS